MSTVVFYISGHGFGHASRSIEVINALVAREPDVNVIVKTTAAKWLFDLTVRPSTSLRARPSTSLRTSGTIVYEQTETDTGLVQIDSLRLDEDASVRRALDFMSTFESRVELEAASIARAGADLVVSDIPALGVAAGARAGVPVAALGNFTWDWAYSAYPGSETLVAAIGAAYANADVALRLPMWGGFETFSNVVDVPFVARHSARDPTETRRALGVPAGKRVVLSSFGGHGMQGVDLDALGTLDGYVFLFSNSIAAGAAADAFEGGRDDGIVLFDEDRLYADGYRYEDVVAASDAVVTKPGYGIIAECLANDTALLYTSRGHFIEYDVLVEEMPTFLRAAFIDHDDLFAGRWHEPLEKLLAQPAPPEKPATNGAEVAADLLLALL